MIVDLQVSFALESAAGCKVALLYDSHARSNSSSLSQGVKKCMGDTWWYYFTDPQMHSFGDGQERRGLVCFSCILVFLRDVFSLVRTPQSLFAVFARGSLLVKVALTPGGDADGTRWLRGELP